MSVMEPFPGRVRAERRALRVVCAFAWMCAAACGGSEKRVAQPGEFTAEHGALYDDGVDLIEDPDSLAGRWRSDWEVELDRRIADGDLVALGKVTTLREEIDPEGRATYHLLFRVDRVYRGKARGQEISLAAREGAGGYASVRQNREHVIDRPLIAFVRYAVNPTTGEVSPHFHLMPPSNAVSRGLQRHDAKMNPHRVKVIEHKQQ
jgi:hypothetical protein